VQRRRERVGTRPQKRELIGASPAWSSLVWRNGVVVASDLGTMTTDLGERAEGAQCCTWSRSRHD
jgi:hypothetical protein